MASKIPVDQPTTRQHPSELLSERWAEALALLADVDQRILLDLPGVKLIVAGSEPATWWSVSPAGCTCPDGSTGYAARFVGGYCKHRLAFKLSAEGRTVAQAGRLFRPLTRQEWDELEEIRRVEAAYAAFELYTESQHVDEHDLPPDSFIAAHHRDLVAADRAQERAL